jgi:hypothetical protein
VTCHLLVPIPFSISLKPSQVSSNLYRQLTPLFQSFFQFSPANLGGGGGAKSFLRQKSFAAEILWQNFAAEFSLPY